MAEWLVTEVRSTLGRRPFALMANSLGGLLARHVGAALPDQVVGMALLAPVVDPAVENRNLPEFKVVEQDLDLLASLTDEQR